MAPGNISVRIRRPATALSRTGGPARSICQFAMRVPGSVPTASMRCEVWLTASASSRREGEARGLWTASRWGKNPRGPDGASRSGTKRSTLNVVHR